MKKSKLKNVIATKVGECRICGGKILPGDEISILCEPDHDTEKFIGHPCKPDIHVYHRDCMDEFLLQRIEMGKPVSGK